MRHVFIDFESSLSKTNTLSRQTIRQYLDGCTLFGMSVALDDEEPVWFATTGSDWPAALAYLADLISQPDVCVVAHNAAFELRVLTYKLGLPAPVHTRCSMEAAMCAFPNHPGGYGLANLAKTLNLGGAKTGDGNKIMKMGPAEMEAYCNQDTRLARALYRVCERRVHPSEWRIAELCNRVRECYLDIDMAAVSEAVKGFTALADDAVADLAGLLDDTDKTAFGTDEHGHARSIKPAQMKALLLDNLGFDTPTISAKKINPVALGANPDAAAAVKTAGDANKALSNKRKVSVFNGLPRIDMELGFYRAHTGRFSSPSSGKGLNLHNLSKHDKKVAKLFRSMFRLPDDLCFVRADEANVEYRCILAGSRILTDSGFKSIEKVTNIDKVWDGVEFVNHGGVVCNGSREVIDVHGVWMTHDHPVLTAQGWKPAAQAAMLPYLSLAASLVGGLLPAEPMWTTGGGIAAKFGAPAEPSPASPTPTCYGESVGSADPVPPSAGGEKPGSSLIRPTAAAGLTYINVCWPVATTPPQKVGGTTVVAASLLIRLSTSGTTSSDTSSLSQDGTMPACPSTASTTMVTTPPEISDARLTLSKPQTSGAQTGIVYDILNAGPRNRFQVEGLIVHNCCGWLTRSPYIDALFRANIFADPYSAFGATVIGRQVTKKDPIRQVFKMAVLGLSYGMGLMLWTKEILKEMAKPGSPLTTAALEQMAAENGWQFPRGKMGQRILKETGCDPLAVVVAYHTREAFHRVHPEFKQLADWLFMCCEEVSRSQNPALAIEQMYTMPTAPDRSLLDLQYTDEFEGRSIKVRCGNWPSTTVVWRDIDVRDVPKRGVCLSSMAGSKGYRALSPSICIENCVQSAARNATCQAKLLMEDKYPYILSVHDEIMPVVPRTRAAILECRADIINVLGPNRLDGWGWSVLINPEEINVSSTLYERDMGEFVPSGRNLDWWAALESGDESLLLNLP